MTLKDYLNKALKENKKVFSITLLIITGFILVIVSVYLFYMWDISPTWAEKTICESNGGKAYFVDQVGAECQPCYSFKGCVELCKYICQCPDGKLWKAGKGCVLTTSF